MSDSSNKSGRLLSGTLGIVAIALAATALCVSYGALKASKALIISEVLPAFASDSHGKSWARKSIEHTGDKALLASFDESICHSIEQQLIPFISKLSLNTLTFDDAACARVFDDFSYINRICRNSRDILLKGQQVNKDGPSTLRILVQLLEGDATHPKMWDVIADCMPDKKAIAEHDAK